MIIVIDFGRSIFKGFVWYCLEIVNLISGHLIIFPLLQVIGQPMVYLVHVQPLSETACTCSVVSWSEVDIHLMFFPLI